MVVVVGIFSTEELVPIGLQQPGLVTRRFALGGWHRHVDYQDRRWVFNGWTDGVKDLEIHLLPLLAGWFLTVAALCAWSLRQPMHATVHHPFPLTFVPYLTQARFRMFAMEFVGNHGNNTVPKGTSVESEEDHVGA